MYKLKLFFFNLKLRFKDKFQINLVHLRNTISKFKYKKSKKQVNLLLR